MRFDQIPVPVFDPASDSDHDKLLRNAPKYLRDLIDKSFVFINIDSLDDLHVRDIKLLSGGVNAVAYMVKQSDSYVVVKFDFRSIKAEAEALYAWQSEGAHVVGVKSRGTVPNSYDTSCPVKYIILDGIVGTDGQPAPTAFDYVKKFPGRVGSIGKAMGRELAVMHRTRSKRQFGEYSDMTNGTPSSVRTWNAYLISYIKHHKPDLLAMGYTPQNVNDLIRQVRETKFAGRRTYTHGDFSLRNTLIQTARPLRVALIDPNPLVGHRTWDLAIVMNNSDYALRKSQLRPQNKTLKAESDRWKTLLTGILDGYVMESERPLDYKALHVTQLVRSIFLYFATLNGVKARGENPATDLDTVVRRQAMQDHIAEYLKPYETYARTLVEPKSKTFTKR